MDDSNCKKIILMKSLYFFFLTAFMAVQSNALFGQFEIGHKAISLYDESRDRDVTTEFYYPGVSPGEDVEVITGEFPLIVFGHGFLMPWSDYSNIWNFLVPEGYVMVFVTTEAGFPDHEAYGLDLAFTLNTIIGMGSNEVLFLDGHLNEREGIMGHSMGGGATWLAAANLEGVETIVGLAPAETMPSAISAAFDVDIPVLVLSGDADGVTPPEQHHEPIYANSASECKAFVSISEGSHCGYADDGTICDIGELFFNGMSRPEQQEITHTLLLYWLGYFLKNQEDANDAFEAYCNETGSLTLTTNCIFSNISDEGIERTMNLFPNPTNGEVSFSGPKGLLKVVDMKGTIVYSQNINRNQETLDLGHLPAGIYCVVINSVSARILIVEN